MTTAPKKLLRIADILTEKGYRMGQQIGEGSYAVVRTAERTFDSKMCAVKIVDRWKAKKDYLKKFMPRELDIVLRLQHDNIICTYEVFRSREFVFQTMQYAEKGDLLRYIHEQGMLPEAKAKKMFRDLVTGVQYLHSLNVAHRDLKCENVLIRKDGSVAVCDFGFARAFSDPREILCETFCGSTAYASPEVLRAIEYDPKANDVWSLGIILYTMMAGSMPFDDTNVTKMVQSQLSKNISFPERTNGKISGKCKLLIYQLLEPDISKRLTVDQALGSEWLKTPKK